MILYGSDSTFCSSIHNEQTGGGVMVDYLEMKDGKIISITDEVICVSNNRILNDNAVYSGMIFLDETDRWDEAVIPKDIHRKIIALCEGDKILAKEAIHKLLKGTTIYKMGKIIDELKK